MRAHGQGDRATSAADILGVVEAENRLALKRFTDAGLLVESAASRATRR